MYYRPNPADDEESEDELTNSEEEGLTVEVLAGASGNHRTDSRCEWNAIKNAAHEGKSFLERDHRSFAGSNRVLSSVFGHIYLFFEV